METEPFNDQDFTDEQLVALLGMKSHYSEGRDMLTDREVKNLQFAKWLVEHGQLDEFNVPNEAA